MENNLTSKKNKSCKMYVKALLSILAIITLIPAISYSQYSKYWIQFTDRANSPYSVATPSAYLSARSIQRRANQNISVVQNDLPVNPNYYDSISKVPNVTVINHSKWFNAITIQTTDTNALNTIAALTFVKQTKPVARYNRKKSVEEIIKPIPNVNKTNPSTYTNYNYGPSLNQIVLIDGKCLHDQGFHGEGMQIAVLDAGFYKVDSLPIFDSLRTNGQILGTWDFVDNDSIVYDSHTHGTMVLSTMGGNVPGMIVGTAPKAKYWLFRTEEGSTEFVIEEDNWVSAAEYADSIGVDILTTSLGYTTFDSVMIGGVMVVNPDDHAYADMNGNTARISIGSDIAVSKGMFAVCSAGNSGGSPWNFIGAPADADSVLAVGSVDSTKNYSWFSSNGPSFDGRVKPNVAAQGQDAVVAEPNVGGIAHLSGTSFACPITAGMVACLWQAHPTATNMELLNAIQNTASQSSNPDTLLGYGISNFCAANLSLNVHDNVELSGQVITVYPNPFNESTTLTIKGIDAIGLNLDIIDLAGKLVYTEKITSLTISLNLNVAKGSYLLRIKDKGNSYSAKIVKY